LVGSPRGISPLGSHRTERDDLPSLRSSHRSPDSSRVQAQCANSLGSRRNTVIAPLRRLPVADVSQLRQTMSDLRPPQPPTPLREWDEAEDVSAANTRAWGGPQYAELRAHLAAFADDADGVDVAGRSLRTPEYSARWLAWWASDFSVVSGGTSG
jgi:hypothetical protein